MKRFLSYKVGLIALVAAAIFVVVLERSISSRKSLTQREGAVEAPVANSSLQPALAYKDTQTDADPHLTALLVEKNGALANLQEFEKRLSVAQDFNKSAPDYWRRVNRAYLLSIVRLQGKDAVKHLTGPDIVWNDARLFSDVVSEIARLGKWEDILPLLAAAPSPEYRYAALINAIEACAYERPEEAMLFALHYGPQALGEPGLAQRIFESPDTRFTQAARLEYAARLPEGAARTTAFATIGAFYAKGSESEVRGALDVLNELSGVDRRYAVAAMLETIAGEHPALVFDTVEKIKDDKLLLSADIWSEAGRVLAQDGRFKALQRVDRLDNPDIRKIARAGVMEGWAEQDPESAANHALNEYQNGADDGAMLDKAFSTWVTRDAKAAVDFLNHSALDDLSRGVLYQHTFPNLIRADPEAARKAITGIREPNVKDQLQKIMASTTAMSDINSAMTQTSQIGDRLTRYQSYTDISRQHAGANLEGTKEIIAKQTDPDVRNAMILGILAPQINVDPNAALTLIERGMAPGVAKDTAYLNWYTSTLTVEPFLADGWVRQTQKTRPDLVRKLGIDPDLMK